MSHDREAIQAASPSRRAVLKSGSAAAFAATVLGPYATAKASQTFRAGGNEVLRVGLIGCGGRGTGAVAQALRADPNTKLVALGEAFRDRLDASLANVMKQEDIASRIDVDEDHKFVGFDAYKGVIDSVDVVLMATSPHFRPIHVEYAVEKGKHMFVEKPVATDGPGLRKVLAAGRRAKEKGLNLVSGLCYRYENKKRETILRIHDGAVGDIVAMQTTYNTGGLWHRGRDPKWSEMEYQMRNWLYFSWLSGDHIAEQHIHSLDKLAWAMQDEYPVKAIASGGRIVRTDPKYGNIYDHFNTVFEWESGLRGFSSCRQWIGAKSDVSDFIYGNRGQANIQRHTISSQGGWSWRAPRRDGDDMYQNEHDALFAAIRKGEPINNTEYMCGSTLMALMGRLSAYTGQSITAEQALNSQEDLSPPAYDWIDLEAPKVAQPGVTQFV